MKYLNRDSAGSGSRLSIVLLCEILKQFGNEGHTMKKTNSNQTLKHHNDQFSLAAVKGDTVANCWHYCLDSDGDFRFSV